MRLRRLTEEQRLKQVKHMLYCCTGRMNKNVRNNEDEAN
jgi:hypothetical protein